MLRIIFSYFLMIHTNLKESFDHLQGGKGVELGGKGAIFGQKLVFLFHDDSHTFQGILSFDHLGGGKEVGCGGKGAVLVRTFFLIF